LLFSGIATAAVGALGSWRRVHGAVLWLSNGLFNVAFDLLPAISQQHFLVDSTLRDRSVSRGARLTEIHETR
jgi:hypothetical protein